MPKRILLPLCVVFAIFLLACGQVTVNRNDSEPPAASSPASTPATVASTSGEKVGVPECDDFIAAYEACITTKVPEAMRAQYKTGIEEWRRSWRKLAENPNTRASLVMACKQSVEQARASMKAYGCAF